MKQSLRQKLNDLIRVRGEISYNEIKDKCESGYFGAYYRMETADRRLRKSESPSVEPVIKDGYIMAWRWVGQPIKYRQVKVLGFNGEVERILTLPM